MSKQAIVGICIASIAFLSLLVGIIRRPSKKKRAAELARSILEVGKEMSGHNLREAFKGRGLNFLDKPEFYSIMAQLEKEGIVRGRYTSKNVEDVTIRERMYHLPSLPSFRV